jgi:uncharacterized protein (DUF983 family)
MTTKPQNTILLTLRKLWVGFTLRCPKCEKGAMFAGLFKRNEVCPHCGVRFERLSGESVGGMFINLGLAEILSLGGFFISQLLLKPPLLAQVIFWVSFNILFVVLFYRHSRSMWVAVAYLANELYTDEEYLKMTGHQ